jgi:hypothetical protein
MDLYGVGALCLVTAEWAGLGWVSGIRWSARSAAPFAPRWALRVMVGAFVLVLAELLLALVGVPFASIAITLVVAALLALAIRAIGLGPSLRGQPVHAQRYSVVPVERRELLGWLLLGVVLIAATTRSLVVPEAGWDAYSHWGLRARAYALAGTLINAGSEHDYYPPLTPLLEAWLYLHRGSTSIDLGKTVWAVIGSAFSVCLAWHLRLSLRARWLAPYVATAILLSTTALLEGFWTGQADLALTAYLTLTALAIYQAQRGSAAAWLPQATLFAAAAALTKLEGGPRVAIIVLAIVLELALSRRSATPAERAVMAAAAALMLGATVVASTLWTIVATRAGINPNSEHLGSLQLEAIGAVVLALAAVFGGVRSGGALVIALASWLLAARRLFHQPLRLLTLVVIGQGAATLLAFLISSSAPEIEVRTSATRLVEQWLPLALFVGVVGIGGDWWSGSYNRRGR